MNHIIREKQADNFTIIPNSIFKGGMSLRAIGLLNYILHLPADWTITKSNLYKSLAKDGRTAIDGAWNELVEAGYILTKKQYGINGNLPIITYYVYDKPQKRADSTPADFTQPEPSNSKSRQSKTEQLLSTKGTKNGKQSTNKQSTIPLSDDKGAQAPESGKPAGGEKTTYQRFMDVYDAWFKERDGVPPKIDGAGGSALKTLIQYFLKIVKARAEKDGHQLDEAGLADKAVEAWGIIFSNWHMLDNFLQAKTRLLDINSNIQNIITQIKKAHERQAEGQPAHGGKKPTGGDVTNTDLLRKVAGVAAAFG